MNVAGNVAVILGAVALGGAAGCLVLFIGAAVLAMMGRLT